MAGVIMELTAGLVTLLKMPAKLGMLANELTMLSKLAALELAAGTGVVVEVKFNIAAAGLATVLAAPAKLGMWVAMLLAVLSMEGGAEGVGAWVAEPPMEVANPANDGMLVAMMSVTPARVGKMTPRPDPLRGGAPSSEEEDTVTSSPDVS